MADWENRQGNKELHERLLFGRKVGRGAVPYCKNQSPVLLTDQSSYTEGRGRD